MSDADNFSVHKNLWYVISFKSFNSVTIQTQTRDGKWCNAVKLISQWDNLFQIQL
jgi:hypothetical protein